MMSAVQTLGGLQDGISGWGVRLHDGGHVTHGPGRGRLPAVADGSPQRPGLRWPLEPSLPFHRLYSASVQLEAASRA